MQSAWEELARLGIELRRHLGIVLDAAESPGQGWCSSAPRLNMDGVAGSFKSVAAAVRDLGKWWTPLLQMTVEALSWPLQSQLFRLALKLWLNQPAGAAGASAARANAQAQPQGTDLVHVFTEGVVESGGGDGAETLGGEDLRKYGITKFGPKDGERKEWLVGSYCLSLSLFLLAVILYYSIPFVLVLTSLILQSFLSLLPSLSTYFS